MSMQRRAELVWGARKSAGRLCIAWMVIVWPLLLDTPQVRATPAQRPPAANEALIIYDGSAVVTASAGRPLTVRLRASAPANVVTYALYRLSRSTFQRLAISYGPVTPSGQAWRLWVEQPRTTAFSTRLDATRLPAVGLYLLTATVAEGGSARVLLVVTRTVLTLKRSPRQIFVWATGIGSGQPVPGARVSVFTSPSGSSCDPAEGCPSNGQKARERLVAAGTTDRDGVFQMALPSWLSPYDELTAAVGSAADQSLASTSWTARLQADPASSGAYVAPDGGQPGGWRAYLYSDRPIYRPGQMVHVRGIIRADDDGQYRLPPPSAPVTLTLSDPNGQPVFTRRLRLDRFGAVNANIPLDGMAAIGQYSLYVTAGQVLNASLLLTVAAYRKPEYTVSITPSGGVPAVDGARSYVQGAPLGLAAQARYYFGAPLAGARVRWAVVSSDYWFNPPAYQGFSFDENSGWWWGGPLPPRPLMAADAASINVPVDGGSGAGAAIRLHGQGKTNEQGSFFWQAPTGLRQGERSQTFTIEATAIDASGQEVAQRTAAVVHRALFYVGLRQARDKGQSFAGQPGKPQRVDVLALGLDGKTLQRGQPVTLSVVRRRWIDKWVRDASGTGQYQEVYQDMPVVTRTVTTGAGGRAIFTFVPAMAGDYRITATARDVLGHVTRSALDIWASSYGQDDADWGARTDDGVRVIPDRATYAPGDVANLLVNAPAPGMLALVTLERGSVLERHLVRLKGAGDVIAVRLGARALPNVFVGVTLVRGESGGALPLWRQGYVQLHVSDSSMRLAVGIRPDRATYRPQQMATLTVTARDATGRPARAALSLAVVDQAVLALSAANTGGSVPAFYFDRPLAVTTAGTLVQLADRLPLGQPFWGCRFCPPQALAAGGAANSAAKAAPAQSPRTGGAGPGGRAAPVPRTYFPDTALWLPSLVTNARGEATVRLRLPDSLTTWALAGTAADAATRVGDGTGSLVVAKDLLVRPELPRFLRAGDHLTLRAVLNNTTNHPLRTTVVLQGEGVTVVPGVTHRRIVTVPANEEAQLGWPAVVGRAGRDARVTISAVPDDAGVQADAVALSLAVEPASFGDLLSGAGASAGESRQTLRLPGDLDTSQGSLRLTLTPSLASGLGPALEYLRSYPYWCAEQTTSHLFPEMALRHAVPTLPAIKRADTRDLRYALRLLQSLQQPDGGWGWWYETGSSPFMTTYAMDGLLAARRAGFPVHAQALARGITVLRQWVENPDESDELANPNVRAYAGYVLTMAGAAWDGGQLYEERTRLEPYGLGYLALALQREGGASRQVASLLSLIRSKVQRDGAGHAWWPQAGYDDRVLESPVRSTAVALDALARLAPGDPLTPLAVRWLVETRQDDAWQDTQDTAISLIALGDYLAHSGELTQSYGYAVMLGNRTVAMGRVTPALVATGITVTVPVSALLRSGLNTLRVVRRPAARTGSWLYYGYTLRYYRRTPFGAPEAHGVTISRRYIVLRGGRRLPEDTRQVARSRTGDVLRVELTVSTNQALHYVMVEDPLPSGAEPLDASLLTSSLATQLRNQGDLPTQEELPAGAKDESGSPLWWWTWYPDHVEVRDDRAALFVTDLAPGVYHYSYLAQVTATGQYRALPAHVEAMYRPQVNGHSAGQQLIVW